jgi:hypothetical protein
MVHFDDILVIETFQKVSKKDFKSRSQRKNLGLSMRSQSLQEGNFDNLDDEVDRLTWYGNLNNIY